MTENLQNELNEWKALKSFSLARAGEFKELLQESMEEFQSRVEVLEEIGEQSIPNLRQSFHEKIEEQAEKIQGLNESLMGVAMELSESVLTLAENVKTTMMERSREIQERILQCDDEVGETIKSNFSVAISEEIDSKLELTHETIDSFIAKFQEIGDNSENQIQMILETVTTDVSKKRLSEGVEKCQSTIKETTSRCEDTATDISGMILLVNDGMRATGGSTQAVGGVVTELTAVFEEVC